jgi:ABC-type lipoprotein release transport system permease subunit
MILLIAWRNVWRNKVRSLVVIASVVVGIWAAAFIISFSFGMKHSYIQTAIQNEVSHLQIHQPGYLDDPELTKLIPHADSIVQVIQKIPQVKAVTARLLINAMASTASNTTGAMVRGIDTTNENAVTQIKGHIISGTYLTGNELPVLVGSALAEKLNLKMHHKLVLTFQDTQGNITAAAFKVMGIYKTANSTFDEANVFVRRSDLANLIGTHDDAAEIAILLKQDDDVPLVQQKLSAIFPHLDVKNWKQIAPDLALMVSSQNESLYLIVLVIVLALMFGIVNTMMMAVLERIHEIGMLMAVGMNKTRLFLMIMTETMYLSFAGIPLGLILSYATISFTGHHGINLGAFSKGLSAYGMGTVVHPLLTPMFYVIVTVFILLAALLGSFYPATKALRVEPAEALQTI